jgi:hypothetical protein
MTTSAETQELLDSETFRCAVCGLAPGQVMYAILAVLDAINQGEPVPSTPSELMAAARCFENCLSPGMVPYAILASLVTLGGGGGGGAQEVYQDAFANPNGNIVPDDPTKPALYFPDGGGTLFQWDVDSQSWV